MMSAKITLAIILVMAMASSLASADITDAGAVNKIVGSIESPVIEPGGRGTFSFSIHNPEMNRSMENIRVNVSIYLYNTIEETLNVSDMEHPPIIEVNGMGVGTEWMPPAFDLAPNETAGFSFDILIGKDTPHGGRFTQATYFIRFWMDFSLGNDSYTMLSRGYISDQDWYVLSEVQADDSGLNRTYMARLGFDGLFPDSSFSVYTTTPLPGWLYYMLVVATLLTGSLALALYVLDNPGKFPKLEKRLQKHWGKFNQFRRFQKGRLARSRRKVDIPESDEDGT